jgi:hypothetical protein
MTNPHSRECRNRTLLSRSKGVGGGRFTLGHLVGVLHALSDQPYMVTVLAPAALSSLSSCAHARVMPIKAAQTQIAVL